MRYFVCLGLLLYAVSSLSAVQERYVRAVDARPIQIFLLLPEPSISFCIDQQSCQQLFSQQDLSLFCQVDCQYPLSYQDVFPALLNDIALTYAANVSITFISGDDALEQLQQRLDHQMLCGLNYVFYVTEQAIPEQGLINLANQGAHVTVIAENADLLWQQKMDSLGSYLPWLPKDSHFKSRLLLLLKQLNLAKHYNAAPLLLDNLQVNDTEALLTTFKPQAYQRWIAQSYRLPLADKQFANDVVEQDGRLTKDWLENADALDYSKNDLLVQNQANIVTLQQRTFAQWLQAFALKSTTLQALADLLQLSPSNNALQQAIINSLQRKTLFGDDWLHPQTANSSAKPLLLADSTILYASGNGELHVFENGHEQTRLRAEQSFVWQAPLLWPEHAFVEDAILQSAVLDYQTKQQINHKRWLYLIMNNNSDAPLLAFDFSSSQSPQLKWQLSRNNEFQRLAKIIAKPTSLQVKYQANAKVALLIGAGYDERDGDLMAPETAEKGNAIYLVDADSGQLIWRTGAEQANNSNTFFQQQNMLHPIASSFAIDELTNNAYAIDIVGQVWRVHLSECQQQQCELSSYRQLHWYVEKQAELAEYAQQRFFQQPVLWHNKNRSFAAVASSNQTQPLRMQQNSLYFFELFEQRIVGSNELLSLEQCKTQNCLLGWKMPFELGEQLANLPVIDGDYLYVQTFKIKDTNCIWQSDEYHLYRLKLSADSRKVELDKLSLAEDSIFRLLDKGNAVVLLPLINRYIEQQTNGEQAALKNATDEADQGVVIHSWREQFH